MPDLHEFYIWLLHQGAPIVVLIWSCFVYLCQAITLCSLLDVRSWNYKTESTANMLQLSFDSWMKNKWQQLKIKCRKSADKMSTISKWQPGLCHLLFLEYYYCCYVFNGTLFCYFLHCLHCTSLCQLLFHLTSILLHTSIPVYRQVSNYSMCKAYNNKVLLRAVTRLTGIIQASSCFTHIFSFTLWL